MKKHLFTAFMFAVIAFFVSCGGSSSDSSSVSNFGKLGGECYPNKTCDKGLLCDTENNICVEDPENPIHDSDETDSGSDGKTDTGSESNHDSGDSQPDGSNTASDDSDSAPDSDEPEPINENPSNLPECSPTSAMPCIDSQALNSDFENTNLIWSEKAPYRMRWIDAMDYCSNLNEGGFNDWLVPTIAALQTLHSTFCDLGGSCSKFGDIAFFWAAGQGYGVDFYNGGKAASKNVDENFDVRCVRKEITTRQAKCTGLPENAEWNTISEITQTWDWVKLLWTPSANIDSWAHSEDPVDPNSNYCVYKCKTGYEFTSSSSNKESLCYHFPECSGPSSVTPCRDTSTGLIWSALTKLTIPEDFDYYYSAQSYYCDYYSEDGIAPWFWKAPTIDELRTLLINAERVQNNCQVSETYKCLYYDSNPKYPSCWSCSSCTETGTQEVNYWSCSDSGQNYSDGRYSKFGDTGLLPSDSYVYSDKHAPWFVDFGYGSVTPMYLQTGSWSDNIRCVHRQDGDPLR